MFCIMYRIIWYFILCASYCILYVLYFALYVVYFILYVWFYTYMFRIKPSLYVPQAFARCSHCMSQLTRSEGSGQLPLPCQQDYIIIKIARGHH